MNGGRCEGNSSEGKTATQLKECGVRNLLSGSESDESSEFGVPVSPTPL